MSLARVAAFTLVIAAAGCMATPPAPAPAPTPKPLAHAAPRKPPAPPDWFHRQLALARHARATHLPPGDMIGAQHAYYAVMLPACARVARSGPAAYRDRCRAIVQHAADAAAAANAGPPCPDDTHDDSADPQAQVVACSD